jgi:hypothetical protein
MSFSTDMQQVVIDNLSELGNDCILTKVTIGEYNPTLGKSVDTNIAVNTYCTASKDTTDSLMALAGNKNFNMSGFGSSKQMIPFQVGYDIDATWNFNGEQITSIEKIEAQNNVIAYILSISSK